jgi:hypothetical protein
MVSGNIYFNLVAIVINLTLISLFAVNRETNNFRFPIPYTYAEYHGKLHC